MKCNIKDEVTLEDGMSYIVTDILNYCGNKYVYLTYKNNDGEDNFLIQKEISDGEESYLVNLDNDEEFDAVLYLISKKYLD